MCCADACAPRRVSLDFFFYLRTCVEKQTNEQPSETKSNNLINARNETKRNETLNNNNNNNSNKQQQQQRPPPQQQQHEQHHARSCSSTSGVHFRCARRCWTCARCSWSGSSSRSPSLAARSSLPRFSSSTRLASSLGSPGSPLLSLRYGRVRAFI